MNAVPKATKVKQSVNREKEKAKEPKKSKPKKEKAPTADQNQNQDNNNVVVPPTEEGETVPDPVPDPVPVLPDISNVAECYVKMESLFEIVINSKSVLIGKENEILEVFNILNFTMNPYMDDADLCLFWFTKADNLNFVDLFIKVWDEFWKDDWVEIGVANSWSGEAGEKATKIIASFRSAFIGVWNAADCTASLCAKLWDKGLIRNFINLVRDNPAFAAKKLNDSDKWEDMWRIYIVNCMQGCIHNSIRHCPEKAAEFREMKGIETVSQYLTDLQVEDLGGDKMSIRAQTAMTIAKTMNEDNMQDSADMKQVIQMLHFFINDILAGAIRSPDRKGLLNFSVEETLEGINCMACIESVKTELTKDQETVDIFWEILKNPKKPKELQRITKTFWTISFSQPARSKLKKLLPELLTEMKKLDNHEDQKVRNAAEGTLWNFGIRKKKQTDESKADIENGDATKAQTATAVTGPLASLSHIMISYDWGHQEIAKALNFALKERGFKTWMDIEQMSGSTTEAMADAVEKAAAVVICFSERYKRSPNCQKEGEYADELHKPIVPVKTDPSYTATGWLGIILAKKLYVPIYAPEDVKSSVDKVVSELNRKLNLATTEAAASTNKKPPTPSPLPPISSQKSSSTKNNSNVKRSSSTGTINNNSSGSSRSKKSALNGSKRLAEVVQWSDAQVQKALNASGVKFAGKLQRINGRMLYQMIRLYKESPRLFAITLDKFGLHSPVDILQLTWTFEELLKQE